MWRSPYGAQTYMLPATLLLGLMGALLLLMVCANVAGLVLVRGVTRRGEMAVRLALGASPVRVVRLLCIENAVLAVPGALIGILLARLALPMMMSSAGPAMPMQLYLDLSTDRLVVAFALLAACASALLFGLVPALRSSRVDLVSVMKDDLSPRGGSRGRFRASLVVVQVAVSLLLLVGAGLVITRSLEAARQADVGFEAREVASVSVNVQPSGYDEARGRLFYQQLLDAGVVDRGDRGGESCRKPAADARRRDSGVAVESHQPRKDEDMAFLYNVVAPDYFRTLRIGLITGRDFERRDDPGGPGVAIVNDTFARRFWGTASGAIGKRLKVATGDWRTVIGVAKDVKYARVNEEPRPHVYLPFLQCTDRA